MALNHIFSSMRKHLPGQGAKEETVRLLSFRVLYLCILGPRPRKWNVSGPWRDGRLKIFISGLLAKLALVKEAAHELS